MKVFFLSYLLFAMSALCVAEKHTNNYYNIEKIQKNFPFSQVQMRDKNPNIINIEDSFQGYSIILYHSTQYEELSNIYWKTLQDAAKRNIFVFLSKNGYTTLLDIDGGTIYGCSLEKEELISVRFTNIDIIPDILGIIDRNLSSWKNSEKKS